MDLFWSIIFVTLGCLVTAEVKNHVCVPSGYDRICIMENVKYQWNGTSTHVFPENLQHVRIASAGSWTNKHSKIPHVDSGLYLMMGRPPMLELRNVGIESLEIPRSLRHGNFAGNSIQKSWVSEDETVEPGLIYLDLSRNWMRQLPTGIELLVNLQVLNLGSNSIQDIPPNTLTKLSKLWYVNLCYNDLRRFSTNTFPISLTHVELYMNNLKGGLNYTELHFPAMEVLNLERNQLKQFDAPALVLAMPRLKVVRIGGNPLNEEQLWDVVRVLRSHNISYRDDADDEACYYYESVVDGVCLSDSLNREPMGTGLAVVFTALVVLVGVVFVLVTRWVLREMNKC